MSSWCHVFQCSTNLMFLIFNFNIFITFNERIMIAVNIAITIGVFTTLFVKSDNVILRICPNWAPYE
jgi:hypothetical protein